MFTEGLRTPGLGSPQEGQRSEPILESARLCRIKGGYDRSDRTYDDAVEAASRAAELVRDTISYLSRSHDPSDLTPEAVASSHKTNCHGHSIVLSEVLDSLGIDHMIGYSNYHSYILIGDSQERVVTLIDTPEKALSGIDVTPALGCVALASISGSPEAAGLIRGDVIFNQSKFVNKDEAMAKRPWYSFSIGSQTGHTSDSERDLIYGRSTILRTYPPSVGRHVLQAFDNFMRSVSRGDVGEAHRWFSRLDGGTYPEIDRRNRLSEPGWLVRRLGESALVEDALCDIAVVEKGITPFSSDLVMRLWPIDSRRRLAVEVGSAEIIKVTLDEYGQLRQQREDAGRSTKEVELRIKKATEQLERMGG